MHSDAAEQRQDRDYDDELHRPGRDGSGGARPRQFASRYRHHDRHDEQDLVVRVAIEDGRARKGQPHREPGLRARVKTESDRDQGEQRDHKDNEDPLENRAPVHVSIGIGGLLRLGFKKIGIKISCICR